ncbi:MAG: TRAP transporter substrate-binding protein DctP [Desulfobacteraceae bacterium]|nr:TRAP transporter substrate-binding protein DctP [Desulfobacteraceae bacterium]
MKLLSVRSLFLALFFIFIASDVYSVTLKIATISPEGSMWMEKMREGAKKVADQTDNRVRFKFYPGGVMGSDKDVVRKMRINQLQGGTFPGGGLATFFKGCQLYGQLMKFNSMAEVDYVRKYMDKYIVDGLEKAGLITFGLAGGGFAYIMSTEAPIETVNDLRKQKIWIPDNDESSKGAIKAFGINPIPLSLVNVKPSMQTGAINTIATTPVGAIILQWHTQVKYLTNMPFLYLYAALAVNKKAFLRISEPDRKIVKTEMTKVFHEIGTQNSIDNIKALEALENRGIKFVSPSKEATEVWRDKAKSASESLVESGILTQAAVDSLDKYLADYHLNTNKVNEE